MSEFPTIDVNNMNVVKNIVKRTSLRLCVLFPYMDCRHLHNKYINLTIKYEDFLFESNEPLLLSIVVDNRPDSISGARSRNDERKRCRINQSD